MEERLPLRIVWFWEIIAAIFATGLLALVLWIFAPHTAVWYILLFLFGGVYLFFAVFYIPMYYINTGLRVGERSIQYRTGVFIVKTIYLLRDQISAAEVCDNPFSMPLSLSTLVVHASGSSLIVPLMDRRRARELLELLQKSR